MLWPVNVRRLLYAFALCLMCLTGPAAWAEDPHVPALTAHEKLLFARYKLRGEKPDYGTIVESLPDFRDNPSVHHRRSLYARKMSYFPDAYEGYNPATDYITVHTDILVQLTTDFQKPMLEFKFSDAQDSAIPAFPYPYRESTMHLVVEDLENFRYRPVDPDAYEAMKARYALKKLHTVRLEMEIRPVSAHRKQESAASSPWVINAETARLRFIDDNHRNNEGTGPLVLGRYTAPWYNIDPGNRTATRNPDSDQTGPDSSP